MKDKLSIGKPFFISLMWTLAGYVLPIIWQDGYLDIKKYKHEFISYFLLFSSMTNLLDIQDYKEDLNNNINTIATFFGKQKAMIISYVLLFSSITNLLNIQYSKENLDNNIFNLILIISNLLFVITTTIHLKK